MPSLSYTSRSQNLPRRKRNTEEMVQSNSNSDSDPALSSPRESVIVVMDANRSKVSVDALEWAIKYLAHPNDTVVVLGVLPEFGKKNSPSCFPLQMGFGNSGIWVRLEFSGPGELSPRELEEEIEKKREEYQSTLQPFYKQCKKNEVKLEVKLAAGYDPRSITLIEAKNSNPRWIVLDSHFKSDKVYIYAHVACKVAVMKGKIATLMPSKAPIRELWPQVNQKIVDASSTGNEPELLQNEGLVNATCEDKNSCTQPEQNPQSPCWSPLSWKSDFPRAFSISELEMITNGFADENIVSEKEGKIYEGICQEMPVVVVRFSGDDSRFWSLLKILSRVRHRNILNLVGYCCTDASLYLLCDYPCSSSLKNYLQCDESAKRLSWKARWYIALEIGAGLRYLHEECADGPFVDLSLSSSSIVFAHGSSAMLCILHEATPCLVDDVTCTDDSPAHSRGLNIADDEQPRSSDVRAYGMLLVELITGKNTKHFQIENEGQSLIDWSLPLLQDGALDQLMDPRVVDTDDANAVVHMARSALLCLKKNPSRIISMSEVLAVVRGAKFAANKS